MGITIVVNEFKELIGGSPTKHRESAEIIKAIINESCQTTEKYKIETYNFKGTYGDYNIGYTQPNGSVVGLTAIMNFYSNDVASPNKSFQESEKYGLSLMPVGNGKLILDEEGYPVAEYLTRNKDNPISMLNLLVDVFNEGRWDLFRHIMDEFNKLVITPITNRYSWRNTQDREGLTKKIIEAATQQQKELVYNLKENVENGEQRVRQYRLQLKQQYDTLYQTMRRLEKEMEYEDKSYEKILSDLDLLLENDKVEDVLLKGNRIVIKTKHLDIHASNGKTYIGGTYGIELTLGNSEIVFTGDNPKVGYWTDHDPHPHVNARNGHACLGNIDSTIAELSAQMEIYAIALICIDFLENANVSDSAGKKVVNWEQIRQPGEPEDKDDPNKALCPICGQYHIKDLMIRVYNSVDYDREGDYDLIDPYVVCEECAEDHLEWHDNAEVYTNNVNYYEEEEEYYDEDDEDGDY